MKKLSFLFLLLLFSFGIAQTYQFDFLTKYSSKDSQHELAREFVTYNNSDNFSYYLHLKKSDSDFTANLYDHKSNLAHNFDVRESTVDGKIQFQFTYVNTSRLQSGGTKNYRYEFSEISDSPKTVLLKIYSSKKAKKPVAEKLMTLEKANKNLIPIYRSGWLHQYSDYENVFKVGDYIVSNSVEKFKKDTCESKLQEYKNVDLQIILPTKLKL